MADNGRSKRPVSAESLSLGYETTDANTHGIFLVGVSGLFFGILIFLVLWWLFLVFKREVRSSYAPVSALPVLEQVPPEPRLQLNPSEDWKKMKAEDLAILNSVGWVDRKEGWVRIPIEDAMRLWVEEERK